MTPSGTTTRSGSSRRCIAATSRSARSSRPRSPACERVNPELNAIAYAAFDAARAQARDPHGGYFSGVPTFIKDNVDVAGMPTREGTDAWVGRPEATRR